MKGETLKMGRRQKLGNSSEKSPPHFSTLRFPVAITQELDPSGGPLETIYDFSYQITNCYIAQARKKQEPWLPPFPNCTPRGTSHTLHHSRVAQRKRAGPITQRSVDRNHALLILFYSVFVSCLCLSCQCCTPNDLIGQSGLLASAGKLVFLFQK